MPVEWPHVGAPSGRARKPKPKRRREPANGAVHPYDVRHRNCETNPMALLAEELVEEWLNRAGYFTIRGVKLGVHEIDLLAVRPVAGGLECRHLEVQASVRPVSYVTRVPIDVQKATGRAAASAKFRTDEELRQGIKEWVHKKFEHPAKTALRSRLAPGPWSRELVLHQVKFEREVELVREAGITVHRLADLLNQLNSGKLFLEGAAGAHLVDLVSMTASSMRTAMPHIGLQPTPADAVSRRG
jgi:hypothetical protein